MDGFNLLGQPSPNKILTPKELADARSVEVNYKSIIEDWNVYRLEGGAKLKTIGYSFSKEINRIIRYTWNAAL